MDDLRKLADMARKVLEVNKIKHTGLSDYSTIKALIYWVNYNSLNAADLTEEEEYNKLAAPLDT